MAVIEDVLTAVDATVASIGASAYDAVGAAVLPVVQVGGVLVVVLVGLNLAIQAIPMTLQNGLGLIVRLVAIVIFVSSFGNFFAVYDVLTGAPARFGATVLGEITGDAGTDLYAGLDELYERALDVGNAVSENGGFLAGAIAGVVMFVIAALMAVVSIVVISAAKLMLGVLIMVAPLAIATTLFKQSAPLFEAFVKLALGFAFVPMLTAAMAGFTITAGQTIVPDTASVETIGDITGFIVVMMLGAGLMVLVPSFAQSLAQTGIALGAIASRTERQAMAATGRGSRAAGKGVGASAGVMSGIMQAAQGRDANAPTTKAQQAGYAGATRVQHLLAVQQRERAARGR